MTASPDLISDPSSPLGVPQVDSPDHIPVLRSQIDALDSAIVRLIAERARLSRRVQAARIAAGGVRIELGREQAVLEGYREVLGENGAGLADAVLRACRGPL
ncbi:MAG TPA: chorismate mutase [Mycobacteriales bacterium]